MPHSSKICTRVTPLHAMWSGVLLSNAKQRHTRDLSPIHYLPGTLSGLRARPECNQQKAQQIFRPKVKTLSSRDLSSGLSCNYHSNLTKLVTGSPMLSQRGRLGYRTMLCIQILGYSRWPRMVLDHESLASLCWLCNRRTPMQARSTYIDFANQLWHRKLVWLAR